MTKRQPAPSALPPILEVGDTVTAPSWGGETAKITEISLYSHRDGSNLDCAILDNGGFWRLSGLLRVEEECEEGAA
jgi:hypothetical protein